MRQLFQWLLPPNCLAVSHFSHILIALRVSFSWQAFSQGVGHTLCLNEWSLVRWCSNCGHGKWKVALSVTSKVNSRKGAFPVDASASHFLPGWWHKAGSFVFSTGHHLAGSVFVVLYVTADKCFRALLPNRFILASLLAVWCNEPYRSTLK